MKDDDLMPFGKHKGVAMANVSPRYLLYIYDNKFIPQKYPEIIHYVEDNMQVLRKQADEKTKQELENKEKAED